MKRLPVCIYGNKKARADSKEWSSFPPATLYYASPSATLTARGCDARTHQPMRHPTNTAPYHARHSFHIPHHAALQHAIAPALHHGGNGAYLDTSQHSCTRQPCIYTACTFPMARRAASDLIPTCRASCSPHCSALRSACCSAFFAGCCTTARSRSRSGRASLLSQSHGRAQHRRCASRLLPLAELQQVERAILNSLIPIGSPVRTTSHIVLGNW